MGMLLGSSNKELGWLYNKQGTADNLALAQRFRVVLDNQ